MPEIGATLREARMRARIDVSEIEAQTKIRAKYLRALENEEWDLLPGPTFVRSFLRTYSQALGLDSKALIEEYRLHYERPSEVDLQPISAKVSRQRPRHSPGPSRGYVIAVSVVCLVIALAIYGLVSSSGSKSSGKQGATNTAPQSTSDAPIRRHRTTGHPIRHERVALSLAPSAEVYVCLVADNGRKVIPGLTLKPGATHTTYHARHFELTLGNNAVVMYVNGVPRTVPPSSRAIGYSITPSGRHTLTAQQMPTCK